MAQSILEDLPEQTFTESTVRKMYDLVNRGKTDANFQKLIYGLVNQAMPGQWKNYKQELVTILNWFKKNIDYRRDPYGVELLQDVWATLDRGRGDCDDATTFLAAAAEVLGAPARIVTVSTRPSKEPNHVYPEVLVSGKWLGMDATVPGSFVGWVPPRVTDRKVWTRSELGLSGGEDTEGIEGLGMSDDIYDQGAFRSAMTPVSGRLAPGVPDDISKTNATGIPGTTNITQRKIWRAPVANNSEWTSDPRPGGGVYGPALPVKPMPTPAELWYLVDRKYVPKVLDPDSAWWGKVPTSKEDLNRMFPGSEGTMANYLKDIASVPASAIAQIENDVKKQVAMGAIGLGDIGAAIEEGLEDYALGLPPRMQRPPGQRGARRYVKSAGTPSAKANRTFERRYLVPAPQNRLTKISGGGLNGLGDALTDAANSIATGVQTGQVPPSAINQAINTAVALITGQPAATPPVSSSSVLTSAIPIGMIGALGLVAWLMAKGGKKKYRSNPSRRRSRGRRGGRGGLDMKTAFLWGGGGLAAYYLFLRPGGILMPSAPAKPGTPAMSSDAAMIAAGIKAAPSIWSGIAKLFSGGSSTPTPTQPTSPVVSLTTVPSSPSSSNQNYGIVTSDQLAPPAPAAPTPDYGIVTDLTAA